MDDSRSVHSSGALAVRAATPSQSNQGSPQSLTRGGEAASRLAHNQEIAGANPAPAPSFTCRCCGGSEFRVETRRGIVKLRVYEAVVLGARSDHYELYTCTCCEASFQRAQDEVRDVLIGKLLFAAKHLAETQFTRRVQYGRAELVCAQCRMAQLDDNRLIHKDGCAVGCVATLLHGLVSLDDPEALQGLMDGDGGFASFPAIAAENGGVQ